MRDFFSESNLRRSLVLGAIVAVMSIPRILEGGLDPWFYIPSAFVGLTLVAGIASAWSKCAGMAGLWPEKARWLPGVGVAVLLASVILPLAVALDPMFKDAFVAAGDETAVQLQYPDHPGGVMALVLWAVSFETLFFVAASAAFFGRLFNRKWLAVAGPVALRVCVTYYQLTTGNVTEGELLLLFGVGATTTGACVLFVNFGFPAPAVFVAVLVARLFFIP